MQIEISNIFHVNLIYNHSLGPELSIMLVPTSQSPEHWREHTGEPLILYVTGRIIYNPNSGNVGTFSKFE